MVDYLGGMPRSSLQLGQCAALLKDLEAAKDKFQEDSDVEYLKLAEKTKLKIVKVGFELLEESFKSSQNRGVDAFLEQIEEKEDVEKLYLSCRKILVKNKIVECVNDLEKNYRLFILGEIQSYSGYFCKSDGKCMGDFCGGSILGKYEKYNFPGEIKDFNNFEMFLYETFSEIFKRLGFEQSKNAIACIASKGSDHKEVPKQILLNIARVYFKQDFRHLSKDNQSGHASIEI